MTILTSVMQFAMLPLQGLGQGAQPIASYNFGAGNAERVKQTFRLLLRASLVYSITLWIGIMVFPQVFVGIFTSDIALSSFTKIVMRVYFASLLIFGIQIACQMMFISIGNAKASIAVAIIRKFVLLIPLILIMPRLFPSDPVLAIYAAEPVTDVIAVIFTTILFAIQFKKAMKELDKK